MAPSFRPRRRTASRTAVAAVAALAALGGAQAVVESPLAKANAAFSNCKSLLGTHRGQCVGAAIRAGAGGVIEKAGADIRTVLPHRSGGGIPASPSGGGVLTSTSGGGRKLMRALLEMQSPASVAVDSFRSCKANLGSHAAQCAAQGFRAGAGAAVDRLDLPGRPSIPATAASGGLLGGRRLQHAAASTPIATARTAFDRCSRLDLVATDDPDGDCVAVAVRAGANDLIDRVAAAIEAAPALDHPFGEEDGAPGRRLQAANVLNATSPLHDAVTAALEAFEECESGTTACHSVGAAWDAGAAAVVDYLVQAAEEEISTTGPASADDKEAAEWDFDSCYTTLTEGWNAQAAAASGNATAVAPIAPTDVAKMLDLAECLNVKVTLLADKMEDEGEGGKRKLLQLGPGGTESWLARLVASL